METQDAKLEFLYECYFIMEEYTPNRKHPNYSHFSGN